MSEPENFVARWARLKRATANEKKTSGATRSGLPPRDPETVAAAEQGSTAAPPKSSEPLEPAFDPASLPPIESITAASDIRAFLQSGVPAELTKAALRRVWTTDPAIRDFIGIAENQWDFTDPKAMPGFGPLEATDDVRELVAQAMGKLREITEPPTVAAAPPVPAGTGEGIGASNSLGAPSQASRPAQASGIPEGNQNDAQRGDTVEEQNAVVSAAPQHDDVRAEHGAAPSRRPHGRALPQ